MRYRLVVTTDGRAGYLDRMLNSFEAKVSPRPEEVLIFDDSGDEHYLRYLRLLVADRPGWRVTWHPQRRGFCRSVADAWRVASEPGPPWVFWSEDDIIYEHGLDLTALAEVLAHEVDVAQMGLMRQPVNEVEIAAGSLFNLYRDRYEHRGSGSRRWLLSRTNFSTGSFLVRRRFMEERPWPEEYGADCEGRFSIDLLAAGYQFAVWGDGQPFVRHDGQRSGTGY